MSLRQLLNFVYSWALERIDSEKLEQWRSDLDAPYWEGSDRRVSDPEAEKAAFRAAMAAG